MNNKKEDRLSFASLELNCSLFLDRVHSIKKFVGKVNCRGMMVATGLAYSTIVKDTTMHLKFVLHKYLSL